jgi:ferrochelatase
LKAEGVTDVVVSPIGFISDHMEVLFDLDTEVRQLADEIGINVIRSATAGVHPVFISMIRELIVERMTGTQEKRFIGTRGPNHDICPTDCCMPTIGRPVAVKASSQA